MSKIILTTESGADLPQELAEKHAVHVVPMHVIMDSRDYLDGQLPVKEIFAYHQKTKLIPSTAATNSYEYEQLFSGIREKDPDCTIIHVGYTSQASASFQNAVIASEKFEKLYLVDALNVTGGLTAVVMYAVQELENNPSIEPEQLIEKIKAIVPKSKLAFAPGSLDFLKAGGRVGNLAYIGGALLKIKPCIELIGGKLVSTKKYRGNMDVVAEKLVTEYLERYTIDRKQVYFIYSIGLSESIKQRMTQLATEQGFENITWMEAGAMISTHAGPGGFGIAGIEV